MELNEHPLAGCWKITAVMMTTFTLLPWEYFFLYIIWVAFEAYAYIINTFPSVHFSLLSFIHFFILTDLIATCVCVCVQLSNQGGIHDCMYVGDNLNFPTRCKCTHTTSSFSLTTSQYILPPSPYLLLHCTSSSVLSILSILNPFCLNLKLISTPFPRDD